MPDFSSYGVFTSPGATRKLSKREIKKLYWRTTNQQSFEGRQLGERDKNECMDQVHKVGERNTKYLEYQEKRAPLIGRSSCTYTAEYIPKPADDSWQNREFAKGLQGASSHGKSAPTLATKTTYSDTYNRGRTVDELKGAKFPPQGDSRARTHTIGGVGNSHVKWSSTHSQHRGPHDDLTSKRTTVFHKANLTLPGGTPPEFWSSQYERDARFCTENAKSRPPSPGPLYCLPSRGSPYSAASPTAPVAPDRLRLALPPGINT